MVIDILTLFPEMLVGPFDRSILKKAKDKGFYKINTINIRDYTMDKNKTTDDYPYGGGSGMIMKPEPIFAAIDDIKKNTKIISKERRKIVYMSPQGKKLNQGMIYELTKLEHIIIICGHYEGVDERVINELVDEEISIGDYILTGGEIPSMVLVDSLIRVLPGVIDVNSIENESFNLGTLEYPQFTRPKVFKGISVPDILLSGDHLSIKKWRLKKALIKTLKNRPDILK